MAVAIRCKTLQGGAGQQRRSSILGVSLLPLVNVFNLGGEAPWHLWVPALAQNTLMTRVLKGEALGAGAGAGAARRLRRADGASASGSSRARCASAAVK